jgi:hypothetical protein
MSEMSLDDRRGVRDALLRDAKTGDTKAIHALARLLDQSFGRAQIEAPADGRDAEDKEWVEMTPAERSAYRAALLEQRDRERAERTAARRRIAQP